MRRHLKAAILEDVSRFQFENVLLTFVEQLLQRQLGLDAGAQHFHIEGLGHVVIRTHLQGLDNVMGFSEGGDQNDRDV